MMQHLGVAVFGLLASLGTLPVRGGSVALAKAEAPPPTATLAAAQQVPAPVAAAPTTLTFGPFGKVQIYRPAAPTHAAVLLSGDEGWHGQVLDMARLLQEKDYLVIGIDAPRYLQRSAQAKQKCFYPPADLQELSQFVEKKLAIGHFLRPVVIGADTGATLAYAALAAAPAGTFDGAVTLGFCPRITSAKPLCKGDGLVAKPVASKGQRQTYELAPHTDLPALWIDLHAKVDPVCPLAATQAFVAKVDGARVVPLEHTGHHLDTGPQWKWPLTLAVRDVSADAFAKSAQLTRLHAAKRAAPATAEASLPNPPPAPPAAPLVGPPAPPAATAPLDGDDLDLPLVVDMPEAGTPPSSAFAIMISGDGGWAGLDRDVAEALNDAGVPVVGLDSLQYFWRERTPDETTRATAVLIEHYRQTWHKDSAILIGYSFGADVLPFVLSRLSPAVRAQIGAVALISPSPSASFEFKVSEWFADDDDANAYPVVPELAKLTDLRLLCFYGTDDKTALCPKLKQATLTTFALPGGHRLSGAADRIVAETLKASQAAPPVQD